MTLHEILSTSSFTLKSETVDDFYILHCDVHKPWTKDRLLQLRGVLKRVAEVSSKPCYAFHTPSHDPLKRKFILQVGGVLEHTRLTDDGEVAEMFRFLP